MPHGSAHHRSGAAGGISLACLLRGGALGFLLLGGPGPTLAGGYWAPLCRGAGLWHARRVLGGREEALPGQGGRGPGGLPEGQQAAARGQLPGQGPGAPDTAGTGRRPGRAALRGLRGGPGAGGEGLLGPAAGDRWRPPLPQVPPDGALGEVPGGDLPAGAGGGGGHPAEPRRAGGLQGGDGHGLQGPGFRGGPDAGLPLGEGLRQHGAGLRPELHEEGGAAHGPQRAGPPHA